MQSHHIKRAEDETSTMTTNTSMANDNESSPLAQVSFPRTGKRGVPQQFPRRLYEMLDSENSSLEADSNHPKVIAWSESGLAFRIFDVAQFSETILPKYFRTKKFSSFQRNLNLVSPCSRPFWNVMHLSLS